MPQNGFTPDHQAFVYEVINVKESFTWTDSYGLIGGSFTISLYLFTLFFGQRRLRPWGIIQRFIFRNRVLRKFPSSVVEIDRPPTPKKTTEFERDSVIDPTDILPQLEAQNTMHTQQSQARDGLNTTHIPSPQLTQLLVQAMRILAIQIPAEMQIHAYVIWKHSEASGTFYLADDIFTKRGESSDNKRSTLQTISELNW
ncbi:hypothetical protein BDF22DRAFT_744638 [Syncephalis plumigaleata]|nr:hypothetical protein BDF22DRAFT_744638 [Syncephalis plumigaleata]